MYKKVLLAYDGSIEGRRALREGAKLAQFCGAEVFLLAVVEPSFGATLEGGVMIPMDEQIATYEAILAEGVERLKAMGFSPTARLGMGAAGQEIAGVAEEIGANLVVVGHRPSGPLARWWFGSVGTYLIKHLRCSVLVAQTEISDDQFAQLTVAAAQEQFCKENQVVPGSATGSACCRVDRNHKSDSKKANGGRWALPPSPPKRITSS
jgi:nucleotide-binding universal stress UspA family protein